MKHILRRFWPIITLVVLEAVLFAANYTHGTYLMGWDNVMPEFNFTAALKTNIFGAWQYHRGLGLADGMGHAANLIHTLFLWMLSAALPQSMLRYAFHFLMHLAGGIGMYVLLRSLPFIRTEKKGATVPALLGALLYLCNLITIQMFFTPLEAFSVHFAALPWLAYSLISYLKKPSRTMLLLFVTVSIFSTPQFFIPTLLLPVMILCIGISLAYLRQWKRIAVAAAWFLCVNAFWLLPYAVNLPYNAPVIANATINRMSSGEVYARNQVFGDLANVLTMKGFMLDFEDVTRDGRPVFVMNTWREWLNRPDIRVIGFTLAGFMILGLGTSAWVTGIWLLSGLMLATNTPGVSTVMSALRDHVPFFAEAYRFPFTKFGLLFGFTGTILTVSGILRIVRTLSRQSTPIKSESTHGLEIACAALVLFSAFPVFRGQLFYDALRVTLPKDYIALFDFMDKKDHSARIANLPQPSYWSWKHYNYGYVGSGFLWYGLSQPLLDRAFDPWSQYNEQYYRELSYALYSTDATAFHAVLAKYDVRYVIYDNALLSPGNNRALIPEETDAILATLRPLARFGGISVYERTDGKIPRRTAPVLLREPATDVLTATTANMLTPDAFTPCGILKPGTARADIRPDGALRLHATNQRGCMSFGIPELSHRNAYTVSVISKHVSGRPILFSIISNTAKHIESESYLTGNDTFALPPLSQDGMGYTVYITNEGFGTTETVNDISEIRFSDVPFRIVSEPVLQPHTITLSQAYNPHWIAWDATTRTMLTNHRMVDTWKNGWDAPKNQNDVYMFFWPQLLEYVGFAILIIGVLMLAI